ncbi:hypothetical protein ACTFIU_002506 [Dictyostelium citrinum]
MESNLITWLNNCSQELVDSVLALSNNRYFISQKSLEDFTIEQIFTYSISVEQYNTIKNGVEALEIINDDFDQRGTKVEIIFHYDGLNGVNKWYKESIRKMISNNISLNTDYVIINNTMIKEIEPKSRKMYFNPIPPVEISHLLSDDKYHDFIFSLNRSYGPYWYVCSALICFGLAVLFFFSFIFISKAVGFSLLFVFGISSICLGIFSFIYVKSLRYNIIKKKIIKFNRLLESSQIPLHFRFLRKEVNFPQTDDNLTMEVYYDFMKNNDFQQFLSSSTV